MARTSQRSIPIALFAIAVALLGTRIAVQAMKAERKASGELVQWLTVEEGLRAASTSNKPVLYDFTAEWCAPCHLLDDEVFRNPALAADINARFIPVRVVDRQQEDGSNPPRVDALQRRFNVNGFPTLVFADAQGNERGRMEGFRGREEFERVMESVR
jgi:thiol:disulfide interchange protein